MLTEKVLTKLKNDKRLTPVLASLVQSSEGVKFIGNWNPLTSRQHIKEKVKPVYDKLANILVTSSKQFVSGHKGNLDTVSNALKKFRAQCRDASGKTFARFMDSIFGTISVASDVTPRVLEALCAATEEPKAKGDGKASKASTELSIYWNAVEADIGLDLIKDVKDSAPSVCSTLLRYFRSLLCPPVLLPSVTKFSLQY